MRGEIVLILLSYFVLITYSFQVLGEESLSDEVAKVMPAAVTITTYDGNNKILNQASGFFTSFGYVISNWHILERAQRGEIKTANGKTLRIRGVVAEDKEADIVLISVNASDIKLKLPKMTKTFPKKGEQVIVVGGSAGVEHSIFQATISDVRDIAKFGKIIQIKPSIPPSSSGGPVLNSKGDVLGVATLQTLEGQNFSFIIPNERITTLKPGKVSPLAKWASGAAGKQLGTAGKLYSDGMVYLWAGDYEKALPCFEEVVKKKDNYADAWFYFGFCEAGVSRWKEALRALKRTIRIEPDYAEAYYGLGRTYAELGRYEEAVESFKQMIRVKPDCAKAYHALGWTYSKLGRYREAVEACEQAIRIRPSYAGPLSTLGRAYSKLGRHKEALKNLKQAVRLSPVYDVYCNLGSVYCELHEYEEAAKAFKQAVRIKPNGADAYYGLGWAFCQLGQYSKAVKAYKRAVRIKPDYVNAYYALGWLYCEQNRPRKAISVLKQAIRIKPAYPRAYRKLGVVYGNMGVYQKAVETFKQAIRIKPDDAKIHCDLAWAYGGLKRYEEAAEAYRKAIRIEPDNAKAYSGLGWAYSKLYRYQEAVEAYKRSIRLKPDYAYARRGLGCAYILLTLEENRKVIWIIFIAFFLPIVLITYLYVRRLKRMRKAGMPAGSEQSDFGRRLPVPVILCSFGTLILFHIAVRYSHLLPISNSWFRYLGPSIFLATLVAGFIAFSVRHWHLPVSTFGIRMGGAKSYLRLIVGIVFVATICCFVLVGSSLFLPGYLPELLSAISNRRIGNWPRMAKSILAGPCIEELIHRGLVYRSIRGLLPSWLAIICSGMIFWLSHIVYGYPPNVDFFIGGCVFAWGMEITKSLMAPILLHIGGNAIGLIVLPSVLTAIGHIFG